MPHRIEHLHAFVADQAIDAVSVAFDSRFNIRRLTLMGQARDLEQADLIAQVLTSRLDILVDQHILPPAHQVAAFTVAARTLLAQAGQQAAVNLNTEDAVSACLMLGVCNSLCVPVFAIDTFADRLVWLSQDDLQRLPLDIQDHLTCADVFALQGYALKTVALPAGYARLLVCAQELLALAVQDSSQIMAFTPKRGLRPDMRSASPALHRALQRAGLLLRGASGHWTLRDYDAVAFLRGNWLELAVYEVLRRVGHAVGALDIRRHVLVQHAESRQVVEFDVACMVNNQLHLIECKSGDSHGSKFISHLEGISRSHGLRPRCMLVSVDALSDALVDVASGMHIACVHGAMLALLPQAISQWLTQATPSAGQS